MIKYTPQSSARKAGRHVPGRPPGPSPRILGSARRVVPAGPARDALLRLRRSYHARPPHERPALSHPPSLLSLIPLGDQMALARAGAWPLTRRLRLWVAEPPSERRRRRGRAAEVVRRVMIDELPDAVALLMGGGR